VRESRRVSASAVSHEAFKRAFRNWPSGVAILTSARGGVDGIHELHGMTVSSLVSVSLEPPLLCVSCDLGSHTLRLLREVGRFAVTILSAEQQTLATRFADARFESVRFDGQTYVLGENGCPLLDGGLAHFECTVANRIPAGDHELVVGSVDRVFSVDGQPLAYWAGDYRGVS
jgi:flavin reductase (DIM6/NTAB) family NADH-FMN oxidoreductase RutF